MMSRRIMVMAIAGLPRIQRTTRRLTPNLGNHPPWSISWKSMNPLSPTKRSSIFWTYSASVIASLARATTSDALAAPMSPRNRLNTSSNETKLSTSTLKP